MKADIDRPLAAILSLNTVAHTIGAAGAGAQALEVFGETYVSVMSAVLTLLILIFSEIIPKTLGAVYWRGLAPTVAAMLPPLIILTYPLVLLSQGFARLISSKKKGPTLDREEFSALAQTLAKEGVFDEKESSVLMNLLRFRSLQARDIMTPRTAIVGFEQSALVSDVTKEAEKMRFSRFPIWHETPDEVSGFVLKHDMMLALASGEEKKLSELKRDIIAVQSDTKVGALLSKMLERKAHVALVVGEYGGTAGVVSMEDVVETLIGMEIVDEIDEVADMQKLARKNWEERAKKRGLIIEEQD